MLKWLGGSARERPPRRVAVIDAAAVDRRRSVVLIRRDNIEHLVMIGGPTDVVIEPNIIRATGAREPAWPAAPGPTRLAGELSNRLTPPEVPPPPARNEAPRVAPPLMEPRGVRVRTLAPPEELAPPSQTVHNLEELKRQLEAALRRSPAPQGRPPVTDPLAVPPPTVSASEQRSGPNSSRQGPRPNLSWSRNRRNRPNRSRSPRTSPQNQPARRPPIFYEAMANLLGCPPGEYFRRRLLSAVQEPRRGIAPRRLT